MPEKEDKEKKKQPEKPSKKEDKDKKKPGDGDDKELDELEKSLEKDDIGDIEEDVSEEGSAEDLEGYRQKSGQ